MCFDGCFLRLMVRNSCLCITRAMKTPSLTHTQQQQLDSVQKRVCRVTLGPAYTNCDDALATLSLPKLSARNRKALEKFGKSVVRHPRLRHRLRPDAPRPVRATGHHNLITPLKAARTDRYRLCAIPAMVRHINS